MAHPTSLHPEQHPVLKRIEELCAAHSAKRADDALATCAEAIQEALLTLMQTLDLNPSNGFMLGQAREDAVHLSVRLNNGPPDYDSAVVSLSGGELREMIVKRMAMRGVDNILFELAPVFLDRAKEGGSR